MIVCKPSHRWTPARLQ